MRSHTLLAAALCFAAAAPAAAQTATVHPVGSNNPFLAGQPAGTQCCGDSAPDQSPTQVPGTLVPGGIMTFSGTGGFNYSGGTPSDSLDGDHSDQTLTYIFDMTADAGTGISGPKGVNADGLVGVFLGSGVPSGTAPAALDYSSVGLGALFYAPGLGQIFWIGDGLTGTGQGLVQSFTVPIGATRLYLGTVDGSGWFNNSGTSTVTVTGLAPAVVGSVPEPGSWLLMVSGFGLLGAAVRLRRAATPAAAA